MAEKTLTFVNPGADEKYKAIDRVFLAKDEQSSTPYILRQIEILIKDRKNPNY